MTSRKSSSKSNQLDAEGKEYVLQRISLRTAVDAGLKSLTGDETLARYGVRAPSVEIPYTPLNGAPQHFTRARLLGPNAIAQKSKFRQPRGTRCFIYVPPQLDLDAVKTDASQELLITEGEIKALAAAEHKYLAIALGGVASWQTEGAPIEDFKYIKLKGRRTLLVFDADVVTKRPVRRELIKIWAYLEQAGAIVNFKLLPDLGNGKTGLDDFLKSKGKRAFDSLPLLDRDSSEIQAWLESVAPLTDAGNAERIVHRHGDDLIYVPGRSWFVFETESHTWIADENGEAIRRALETVRAIYSEAAQEANKERRQHLGRHARASENVRRIEAMVKLASCNEHLVKSSAGLDANPLHLGTPTGVIDLASGQLIREPRTAYVTRRAGVAFDPRARAPHFDEFLRTTFGGRRGLISYVQRFAGYIATGHTGEQLVHDFHGPAQTGKSLLVRILRHVLGDYARSTQIESWTRQYRQGAHHSEDLAGLDGVRLVVTTEANQISVLDEALIKRASGEDLMSVRGIRERQREFQPRFKLLFVTNHDLRVDGGDPAMRRRVRRVPFDCRVPDEKVDRKLFDLLKAEGPGILNWIVKGTEEWLTRGLAPPEEVLRASEAYLDEQDLIGTFIEECCVLHASKRVEVQLLFGEYTRWTESQGRRALPRSSFSVELRRRGIEVKKSGSHRYIGIDLTDDARQRFVISSGAR